MRHLRRWYVYVPVTLAIVALLAWRTRLWEAGDLLRSADPGPIAVAIALNLAIVGAWAGRSRQLLRRLGQPVGFVALLPIVSFANTINGLTPASAGELVRAVLLNRRHGVPYGDGAAVILIERVYALALIAASAVTCFVIVSIGGTLGLLVGVAFAAVFVVPTAGYRQGRRFAGIVRRLARGPLAGSPRVGRAIDAFAAVEDRVATVLSSGSATVGFVAWSAVVFVSMDAQLLLVGSALGTTIDPVVGWAALGLGAVAGVLSALPFGLGAADAVIALVLIGQGMPPATATLVTILMRLVGTLPTGILGAISYVWLNRTDPGLVDSSLAPAASGPALGDGAEGDSDPAPAAGPSAGGSVGPGVFRDSTGR